MSHFTHIKTRFQNLIYLEKALNKLEITNTLKEKNGNPILVIPQSNKYDINFIWNGQEYELVADMSFWQQPYPVEVFIDKVAQKYAGEVIIGETQKIGFQSVKYKQNLDGSNTLILERWRA
jgi:hypothetical protein